jgi:hypothetical protein
MVADRRAQVLRILAWLATLPHGYEWAERWRTEYGEELQKIDEGKAA